MDDEKQKLIEILERKLLDKESELNELYDILGRLNSYIKNLITDTEAGVRAAMSLHRKLSSRSFPQVSGITFSSRYVVSTTERSSYYEVFEIESKEGIGIIVCDSEGYGVSSLIMSIVISLLDTPLVKSPKAFFDTLIKDICNHLKNNSNVSEKKAGATFISLDRKSLSANYCSVGMPNLLVIRNDERILLDVDSGNLLKGFETKERNFKMQPGDRILILNNATVNAINSNNEPFGIDRFVNSTGNAQHLSIGEIIANISFEIDSYMEGKRSRLLGDLTIVGMEIERRTLYVV